MCPNVFDKPVEVCSASTSSQVLMAGRKNWETFASPVCLILQGIKWKSTSPCALWDDIVSIVTDMVHMQMHEYWMTIDCSKDLLSVHFASYWKKMFTLCSPLLPPSYGHCRPPIVTRAMIGQIFHWPMKAVVSNTQATSGVMEAIMWHLLW